MQDSLPEVEVIVPCVEGQQHPIRLRLHSWAQWQIVHNPCAEMIGPAFVQMAPCSAHVRARGAELRRAVVKQLAGVGAMAVPALIKALRDGDWDVRRAACEALGRIGDASAVPALIKALRDWDWNVRQAAQNALERIRTRQKQAEEAKGE